MEGWDGLPVRDWSSMDDYDSKRIEDNQFRGYGIDTRESEVMRNYSEEDFLGPLAEGKQRVMPELKVEKTYKFNETSIKDLIIDYLASQGEEVKAEDISITVREASYDQYYSSPASVEFRALIRTN